MVARWSIQLACCALLVSPATAQTRVAIPTPALPAEARPNISLTERTTSGGGQWRTPIFVADKNATAPTGTTPAGTAAAPGSTPPVGTSSTNPQTLAPLAPVQSSAPPTATKVTQTKSLALPNEAGQVWREYDITSYTARITTTGRPEQAIVDWILRETGYEAWHSEPLGILSAGPKTLRVYHTPEMHAIVAEIVDRFVNSETEAHGYNLRVVSIGNPNWRTKAQPLLRPVAVQSPGVQAWLVQREDAALLLAELRRRMDFREHSAPQFIVQNGQSGAIRVSQSKNYVRNVAPRPDTGTLEPDVAQFDEGFGLELSPLLAIDGRTIDAVLKCQVDQLERLVPVLIDAPAAQGRQRLRIDVPQASHFQFQERFRWPADQVLIVGMGMVAPPTPGDPNPLVANLPLIGAPDRADLLVIIESRGKLAPSSLATPAAPPTTPRFGGRY